MRGTVGPSHPRDDKPTLLVGAGDAAEQVLKSMLDLGPRSTHRVGLVDDDPLTHHAFIHGVEVPGPVSKLERFVETYGVQVVVICVAQAQSPFIRDVVQRCHEAGVRDVRVLPPLSQVMDEAVTFQTTREVSLEGLLGRETVTIRHDEVRALLQGKRVVVTGGAGTIGSELCRQVARFGPEELVVVDLDETRLHDTGLELRDQSPRVQVHEALVDVRDARALRDLFASHTPDVVFHAAAMKHVPMTERWPLAAPEVNVLGTTNVLEAAEAAGCERFVLISTDKAVEPSSVMGASKRLAELVLFSGEGEMVRSAVRFGNVIGSRGSVIPTFERQLAHGGPLTVTHPDMERFFMMTSEAVSLVLQAAAQGKGGDLFVLDMGKPVRILDVAREFCRLKGYEPGVDVDIVFTGLRPGEKLVEVLHYPFERLAPAGHERLLRAEAGAVEGPADLLDAVQDLLRAGDPEAARRWLGAEFPSLAGDGVQPRAAQPLPPAGR